MELDTGMERRFFERVCLGAVDCVIYYGNAEINAVIVDVSENGCGLTVKRSSADHSFEKDESLEVCAIDGERCLRFKGDVVWSSREDDGMIKMGLRIKTSPEYEKYVSEKKVERFVKAIREKKAGGKIANMRDSEACIE